MSSFKDKLERLHGSRERARRRSNSDDGSVGVFRAEHAEESDRPPGETGGPDESPTDAPAEKRDEGPTDGPTPAREGREGTDEPLRLFRNHSAPGRQVGSVPLDSLRTAPLDELLERFTPLSEREADSLDCSDILFFDTETTGLGTDDYAFCLGWGALSPEGFRLHQAVLGAPEAEPEAIRRSAERIRSSSLLCTYNGANFDLPLLERRADELGIETDFSEQPHLDLLPVARTICSELDRHRLTDLESRLLGHRRRDDLPGSEVPEVWERYLGGAKFSVLEPVLRHNRTDVASLCASLSALADRAARRRDGPDSGEGDATEINGPNRGRERPAEPSGSTTGEGHGVEERLARTYSLRSRGGDGGSGDVSRETGPSRETGGASGAARAPSSSEDRHSRETGPKFADDLPDVPRERARALRKRAERLIAADDWDRARPLLHELVALHPRHPFGLERLADLYENEGERELADHYRSRLREAAPF